MSRSGRGARWLLLGMLVSRLLLAAFLVLATYNPTGTCYVDWMRDGTAAPLWKLIVSAALLLAYGVAVPVAVRALGFGGIAITASIATAALWLLLDAHLISLAGPQAGAWLALAVAAFVLGVGVAWMAIATALDGQLRTRDLTL